MTVSGTQHRRPLPSPLGPEEILELPRREAGHDALRGRGGGCESEWWEGVRVPGCYAPSRPRDRRYSPLDVVAASRMSQYCIVVAIK